MDKNEIIIALVKSGFNYTFEYQGGVYSNETRQIVFTKTGFKSTPILMKDLNQSHIDQVKKENEK